MNGFFANLYEYIQYNTVYSGAVFSNGEYQWLGLVDILSPIVLLLIFYRFWDPLPTRRFLWFLVILTSLLISFSFTYYWLTTGSMNLFILNNQISAGITPKNFVLNLGLISIGFTLIIGLISSFLLKYLSINNSNNPF